MDRPSPKATFWALAPDFPLPNLNFLHSSSTQPVHSADATSTKVAGAQIRLEAQHAAYKNKDAHVKGLAIVVLAVTEF